MNHLYHTPIGNLKAPKWDWQMDPEEYRQWVKDCEEERKRLDLYFKSRVKPFALETTNLDVINQYNKMVAAWTLKA